MRKVLGVFYLIAAMLFVGCSDDGKSNSGVGNEPKGSLPSVPAINANDPSLNSLEPRNSNDNPDWENKAVTKDNLQDFIEEMEYATYNLGNELPLSSAGSAKGLRGVEIRALEKQPIDYTDEFPGLSSGEFKYSIKGEYAYDDVKYYEYDKYSGTGKFLNYSDNGRTD